MPRLLDLFCSQGGAAMGYHRAGFEVVGVDIKPQPNFPFAFVHSEALEYVALHAHEFDAIHASPPCQRYIRGGLQNSTHPNLLPPTRDALDATGLPYVIENVPGSPMRADFMLCGSHFGLQVRRHRHFECNWPVFPFTLSCNHDKPIVGVYGNAHGQKGAWPGMLPSSPASWSRAMGIDWMDRRGLAEAIPPAYTEHIGRQLLAHLQP